MSHGKQFTLFSHKTSPNGWKVAVVLEELGLTYETKYLNFQTGEQKDPVYTKLNPNGKIPAIIDHFNNDLTLWESGAILGYLIMRYDPERKISATTEQDKALELQWMSFQISEVAPYYGQAFWFTHYHPEHLPSAIARYKREIVRMFGVLDGVLAEQEWLVGGRPSVADFSFIMWNELASPQFVGGPEEPFDIEGKFPHYYAWLQKLRARPSVVKIMQQKVEANKV